MENTEKKHHIVELQEDYIETGSEQILEDIYVELLKIGFFSLKKKRFYKDTGKDIENIVFDVVQYIVMRLMTEQKIIIEIAPVKYIETAIYYSSFPEYKTVYQLKPEHLEDFTSVSAEEECIKLMGCEEMERDINKIVEEHTVGLDEDDINYVKQKVFDCLENDKPYQKFLYKVRKKFRPVFKNILEDIKVMLKERM